MAKDCSTNFETGACESVLFLGGLLDLTPDKKSEEKDISPFYDPFLPDVKVSNRLSREFNNERIVDTLVVEEIDAHKNTLISHKLTDLILSETETVDVLKNWLENEPTWKTELTSALLYLLMQRENYRPVMFKLEPRNNKMTSVRIHSCMPELGYPTLLISAMETLPTAEKTRYENLSSMLKSEKETLQDYLAGNSDAPLLKPDKAYRIAVNYAVKIETKTKKEDSFEVQQSDPPKTQKFAFKTDKEPPKALSPYVLGTTPKMEASFHFYEDPMRVVFNDDSFLKMFQAYGKKLKAVIRGADGKEVGGKADDDNVENNAIGIDALNKFPAQILPPYRETLESLAKKEMPCIGAISSKKHARFDVPFDLKPGMPYTFDIEVHAVNTDDDAQETDENEAIIKPFFRRAFKTSRFANLGEFAKNCRANGLNHQAMTTLFENLPHRTNTSGKPDVHTLTDIAFENLLKSGGIGPTENNGQSTISLCWLKASGNSNHSSPFALLIDASEPLWRTRKEPKKKAVLNAQMKEVDPDFKIYQEKEVNSMLLQPTGNESRITQFIKTTSGTKTLVLFAADQIPEEGEDCKLELVQTASELFNLEEKTETLITFRLLPKAPWED